MDRVECQFKNYISDLTLNLEQIETLMTKLVDEGVISTSDDIISSGKRATYAVNINDCLIFYQRMDSVMKIPLVMLYMAIMTGLKLV